MTYYSVIGGWILKYITVYLSGAGQAAADSRFFGAFITADSAPLIFNLIFLGLTALIVYKGVEKGIEKSSVFIMPVLLLVVVGISLFSLTLSHTDAGGVSLRKRPWHTS